jgi:hypothetical protein
MSVADLDRCPPADLGPRSAYVTMVAEQVRRADTLTFALAQAAARDLTSSRIAVAYAFGLADWRSYLRHMAAHVGRLPALEEATEIIQCARPSIVHGHSGADGPGRMEPVFAAVGHVLEGAGVTGQLNLCARPWTTAYFVRVALAELGPDAEAQAAALVESGEELAVIDLPLTLQR